MAGSINTLSGVVQTTISWNAQDSPANLTGALGITNVDGHQVKRTLANGTGTGNINQGRDFTQYVANSASVTIDLTSTFTNLVNDTTANFARLKAICIHLLGPNDDATLVPANGANHCRSVLVDWSLANGITRQSGTGGPSGTGNWALASGEVLQWGGNGVNSANGAGGVVIDATHKNLKITNEDASNAALVRISLLGCDV